MEDVTKKFEAYLRGIETSWFHEAGRTGGAWFEAYLRGIETSHGC